MQPDARLAPELARLLERVAAEMGPLPDPTLLPAAEGRALTEASTRRWNVRMPAMRTTTTVWAPACAALATGPVRMRAHVPPDPGAGVLLFVHGGGFCFGSPETHERCARVLAAASGLCVLVPDFRLAPEHPYPQGLFDVVSCLRASRSAAAEAGSPAGPVMIAGESSGANMALAAILHEQALGRDAPCAAVLFCGTYGQDFSTESYRSFADGPGLTRARMQRYWQAYSSGRDLSDDPFACPLIATDAALAALPPTYLVAAGVDPLVSETQSLHSRLRAVGRDDPLTLVTGMTHAFIHYGADLEQGQDALARAGHWARQVCNAALVPDDGNGAR